MNVLEKILEEIEHEAMTNKEIGRKQCEGMARAMNIIRSHMDEAKDINVPSNDDWIPVEERLPEEKGDITKDFNLFKESLHLITDGVNVIIATFDGGYFRCCDDYVPYTDVTAWQPLPEPYKPKQD